MLGQKVSTHFIAPSKSKWFKYLDLKILMHLFVFTQCLVLVSGTGDSLSISK